MRNLVVPRGAGPLDAGRGASNHSLGAHVKRTVLAFDAWYEHVQYRRPSSRPRLGPPASRLWRI